MSRKGRRPSKARPRSKPSRRGALVGVVILSLIAVAGWALHESWTADGAGRQDVLRYRIEVIRTLSHDSKAFTQGLVWHRGSIYESTGQYGNSSLRRLNSSNGQIEMRISLPSKYFGEGLALADDRLFQITWKQGVAFVYDLQTMNRLSEFRYQGEGWGLCWDGGRLVMSDGSDRLSFRSPEDFSEIGSLRVTSRGRPLDQINELECVDGRILANIWQRDIIVEIDPSSGRVVSEIDASGLLSERDAFNADVLNGIAYNPQSQTYFLTGKLWPRMFEVRFVEENGPSHPRE